MNKRTDISGVILAGGKSTRMGEDKAMLILDDKPFIQHIAVLMTSIFDNIFIVSDELQRYTFLNLPMFPDVYKDCGPLGGIHSALVHSSTERIFVVSCDTPMLHPTLIKFLLEKISDEAVLVPAVDLFVHPLCGLYTKKCLPIIEQHLLAKQFSVMKFLEDVPTVTVQIPDSMKELAAVSLFNVNNPENYRNITRQF